MGVTGNQIRSALISVGGLGGQMAPLDDLAKGANNAMAQSGINTRQGAACFLAQCMVESAYLRTTTEYTSQHTKRYDPYRGRGFIQRTWKEGYRAFGQWAKARGLITDSEYFVKNPARLADNQWAWLVAVEYFTTHRHGLVTLANRGENIKVGRAINRGNAHSGYAAYGEDHRKAAYNALLRAGVSAPSGKPGVGGSAEYKPTGKWSTKKIQTELGLKADGKYGSATTKAVKEWQKDIGVTADGLWGPSTEEVTVSIQEDIAKVARDVKELKTEQKKIPARVWAHQIDTPKSVLSAFPWFNKKFTAGGAQMYNLFSFGAKDDTDRIIRAIKDDQ